jgi:hypothetical protein
MWVCLRRGAGKLFCASEVIGCTWESHVAVRDGFKRVDILHAVDMLLIFRIGLQAGSV